MSTARMSTAMEPVASTSASFNKTHPTQRVLSLYYPQIRTLASLFPCGLLKEKDSERFNRFLHESLVASTLSDPIAFDALADEDRSFGMSEILQQVLQIVFKRHATEYHEARRLGLPAFSTPKNVLAAGHRLVRNTLSQRDAHIALTSRSTLDHDRQRQSTGQDGHRSFVRKRPHQHGRGIDRAFEGLVHSALSVRSSIPVHSAVVLLRANAVPHLVTGLVRTRSFSS